MFETKDAESSSIKLFFSFFLMWPIVLFCFFYGFDALKDFTRSR